jgi:hypothetical protein
VAALSAGLSLQHANDCRLKSVGVRRTDADRIRAAAALDLAATRDAELAQSYERTAFGAGSAFERWDWAPIYLSNELLDTEYGSLLNVADQMLKGWSQCGTVDYYNFPHPAPSRFPFDGPLNRQLKANQLLFNFNTTGFGISAKTDVGYIYAITRSGALPVIYRPEQAEKPSEATKKAEDEAYRYYAALNEPLLARVVQYASLYQIFFNYDVQTDEVRNYPTWKQSEARKAVALTLLKHMREATPNDIDKAAARARRVQDARCRPGHGRYARPGAGFCRFRNQRHASTATGLRKILCQTT